MSETITVVNPPRIKSPRGYVGSFALSSFGIYVALLAPVYGGLSVKIQEMSGIDSAPALLGLLTGAGALFSTVVQPVAGGSQTGPRPASACDDRSSSPGASVQQSSLFLAALPRLIRCC
ncbi:hypothetical protein [Paenarthrobacter ilicis]|uniref:hypothetical protein n=1 Tax=Paenarthrobacter ilicis TaxID=43665 RepID=UPI0038673DDF